MPIGGTAFFGQNQHPRITTNYLNQLHRHGDPGAGVNVSTAQMSGSIVQEYLGFAGGKLTITNPWAKQFADPAVGPLFGGIYQYVRFDPAMGGPATRGAIAVWLDEENYIVTINYNGSLSFKVAGVIINETLPGNWDFIQIAGIAMALSADPGSIGNIMSFDNGTVPPMLKVGGAADPSQNVGIAVQVNPVANAVSPVQLNLGAGYNF